MTKIKLTADYCFGLLGLISGVIFDYVHNLDIKPKLGIMKYY